MRPLTRQSPKQCAQELIDGCGRRIDHLRLSVTDRCNLACRYCSTGHRHSAGHRLDVPFAYTIVRWLSTRHGVRHVRLTGGEPLLHPQIVELIEGLAGLETLEEITLTTNGQTLARKAIRLRNAGLTRVNVSLDTLNADRFDRLTRGGLLSHTLQGIESALAAGLTPVRLNTVVQRGGNDDELGALAAWGLARGCTVRFLEMMPIGPAAHVLPDQLVPASEILEILKEDFVLSAVATLPGQPATDYAVNSRLPGGPTGRIGVIASTTRPFCEHCRRLRITSGGEILSCLFDAGGSNLAAAWNGHELNEYIADAILQAAVMAKPRMGSRWQPMHMIAIGG